MEQTNYTTYHGKVAEVNTAFTQMEDLCGKLALDETRKSLEETRRKLTSHKFSVGIVGEFKHGKSTVINALLGKRVMPADVVPCTAALNRVTYDMTPHAKVIMHDGSSVEVSVDEIADYVTKINVKSAQRAEMVEQAVVYYPCQFCQNGVDIIDTPGLNDEEAMDEITEKSISKLDAVIMVLAAHSPFSMSERDFIRNKLMTSDLSRLIFVVNYIDMIDEENRPRILEQIRSSIQKSVLDKTAEIYGDASHEYADAKAKLGTIQLYPISAKQALNGRLKNKPELVEESGIKEFEDALTYMLTVERGALELATPLSVIARSATEVSQAAQLRKDALSLEADSFNDRQRKALEKIEQFREAKKKEASRIQACAHETRARLLPEIAGFYDKLEKEINAAAEQVPVKKQELDKEAGQKAAAQELQRTINETIQGKTANFCEWMQKEIMNDVGDQTMKSALSAQELIQSLNESVAQSFAELSLDKGVKPSGNKNAINAAGVAFDVLTDFIGGPLGLSGMVSGFQEAGLKGGAVGLGAGVAVTLACCTLLGPLGIVGLPLCAIASLASGASGTFIARKLFPPTGEKEYAALMENVRRQTKAVLAQMRASRELEHLCEKQIDASFDHLAAAVNAELEKALKETERTIDAIKQDLTKNALQREQTRKECDAITASADQIMERLASVTESVQKSRAAS